MLFNIDWLSNLLKCFGTFVFFPLVSSIFLYFFLRTSQTEERQGAHPTSKKRQAGKEALHLTAVPLATLW